MKSIWNNIEQAYRRIMKNPAQQALILPAVAFAGTYMAYPAIQGTLNALIHPLKSKIPGQQQAQLTEQQQKKKQLKNRLGLATLIALGTLGTSAYVTHKYRGGRVDSFDPWPSKSASYMTGFNPPHMSQMINVPQAMDLFRHDPMLLQHNPYAANFGTSVIAAAAPHPGTRAVPLGNVFDSAVNKVDSRLGFAGVAQGALRTGAAYATASLLTNAIGGMMGLPKQTRDNIISAGTWAGAISSILS